jgi:hypothetical protein
MGNFGPWAGLAGGMIGALLGALQAAIAIRIVAPKLREMDRSATDAERAEHEGKISLFKRIIVVVDVLLFAAIGYWLGSRYLA